MDMEDAFSKIESQIKEEIGKLVQNETARGQRLSELKQNGTIIGEFLYGLLIGSSVIRGINENQLLVKQAKKDIARGENYLIYLNVAGEDNEIDKKLRSGIFGGESVSDGDKIILSSNPNIKTSGISQEIINRFQEYLNLVISKRLK